jgi:hypothetical protein
MKLSIEMIVLFLKVLFVASALLKVLTPVDIQKLRIRIYDDHGRILNMNNSNYSFCLDFKMLYDL